MGSLQPVHRAQEDSGVKNRTVNYAIQTVRHILNLAASEWIDENERHGWSTSLDSSSAGDRQEGTLSSFL